MKELFKNKTNIFHIVLIILGAVFVLIPAFHTNLWFDESYSVAMVNNNNFAEIWSIGGYDVHPVLYYWMLRIVFLIFGNNILAYRLFSIIPIVILGILGFTHIKKDFGKNTGLLFTFFSFFLPISVVYASEIRMYTWAMLFVSIIAIYAYRIYTYKTSSNIKNWIIFTIFSLGSAYIHYYGLMAAGIINLMLFIHFVLEMKKQKKITKNMKYFIISAIVQIALYIPWLIYFILQVSQVSSGFWIGLKFPDTLIEMFTFQFTGNLEGTIHIDNMYAIIFGLIMCIYLFYILQKNRKQKDDEKIRASRMAISIYGLVILGAAIISLIILQPIIYARYFLVITGLFVFYFSNVMANIGNKKINILICILTFIIATCINVNMIKDNYDSSNAEPIKYFKENVKEDDILIYGNVAGEFGSGFVVSANNSNNTQYFWDYQNWNKDESYDAYGRNMKTVHNLDDIKDYKGRIWVISSNTYNMLELIQDEYDIKVLEKREYKTKYQKYQYAFALVEKY